MTAPAWHQEAKKMRAEGISLAEIARRLGYCEMSVSYAVNDNTKRVVKFNVLRRRSKRAIRKKPVSLPIVSAQSAPA